MGMNRIPGAVAFAEEATRASLARIIKPVDLSGSWKQYDWMTTETDGETSVTFRILIHGIHDEVWSSCYVHKDPNNAPKQYTSAECNISFDPANGLRWKFNCYRDLHKVTSVLDQQRDAEGFVPNGWINFYPHDDAEHPCTLPCCEPSAYQQPYRWRCQGKNCNLSLRQPGECVKCALSVAAV